MLGGLRFSFSNWGLTDDMETNLLFANGHKNNNKSNEICWLAAEANKGVLYSYNGNGKRVDGC